jgi:hypothetical protein
MHGKKCPRTLQEAKPTAGSFPSSRVTEADRTSERSPEVDANSSPADPPHRDPSDPVSSRPPRRKISGRTRRHERHAGPVARKRDAPPVGGSKPAKGEQRTEPHERRRVAEGRTWPSDQAAHCSGPRAGERNTAREKARRCMTRSGRRVRGGGAWCGWVGRERDANRVPRTSPHGAIVTTTGTGTGRLPTRRPLRRADPAGRPPPLVHHGEHLHVAFARQASAKPQGRVSRHGPPG